jgi:hypothetical protein
MSGGIMKTQHKGLQNSSSHIVSKEEQRKPLCCNIDAVRCSSLPFNSNNPLVSDEMLLEYLADILVDIYLAELQHGKTN